MDGTRKARSSCSTCRAGLDAAGRMVAWDTQMWIPANRRGARILLAAQSAGIPQDSGRDAAAVFENGDPAYLVDHVRVLAHWMRDTPLNPSNLRAPGKPANVFAVESFTDEIAATLRADALEFRTARLTDPRALEVLTRAAAAFRWQRRPSPNDAGPVEGALLGRGVAYTRYKQAENYIATFIEVAVYPESGRIAVRRVVCAHDCGLVVNPDALRNQIEGGIVQTLSRALHEEVQFDESRVTSVDWSTLSDSEVPGGTRGRGDPDRAAGPALVGRGRSRRPCRSRRRWGTRCSTRPACACAACRSPPHASRRRLPRALRPGSLKNNEALLSTPTAGKCSVCGWPQRDCRCSGHSRRKIPPRTHCCEENGEEGARRQDGDGGLRAAAKRRVPAGAAPGAGARLRHGRDGC